MSIQGDVGLKWRASSIREECRAVLPVLSRRSTCHHHLSAPGLYRPTQTNNQEPSSPSRAWERKRPRTQAARRVSPKNQSTGNHGSQFSHLFPAFAKSKYHLSHSGLWLRRLMSLNRLETSTRYANRVNKVKVQQ